MARFSFFAVEAAACFHPNHYTWEWEKTRFPYAKRHVQTLLPSMVKDVILPTITTAFTIEEVQHTPDLRFISSVSDQLDVVSENMQQRFRCNGTATVYT